MAFESNNFNVARKVNLPKSEVNVECSISISDEIRKILSVSADPCVTNYEILQGVVSYAALIDVCVVYLSASGEIGKVNSICPFSSKISSDSIIVGQKATIRLISGDVAVESVGQDAIKVNCSLGEVVSLVDNCEIKSIKCFDESVCTKEENVSIVRFVGESCASLTVSSTYNTRESIKRLIMSESQVLIKNSESGSNFVAVSGDVITRLLYVTESDRFENYYVVEPFKEEIELNGQGKDSTVEVFASVKRDAVNITIEQEDKGSVVKLDIPITICVKGYENAEISVVKDIYSVKNELKITTESFNMSCLCPSMGVEGKIDGTLTLGDDKPRVDKILFVGGNSVTIANATVADGEITIEGTAKTNVIYLNDDENSLSSVNLEVPFVITDKFAADCQNCVAVIDAVVCDVDVVVKKGRELFYDAKIKANVECCYDQISGVITEVVAADELPERDFGLELVLGKKGQDAWEIAKEIKVSQDLLIAQNQDVVFPLEEDKNLVLFYQKTN